MEKKHFFYHSSIIRGIKMENKNYNIPCPTIDIREEESCKLLTKRYEEMTQPTLLNKAGKKLLKSFLTMLKNSVMKQD